MKKHHLGKGIIAIVLSIVIALDMFPMNVSTREAQAGTTTETITETWTMNGAACTISDNTLSNGSGNRIVLSNSGGWLNNGTRSLSVTLRSTGSSLELSVMNGCRSIMRMLIKD